MFRFHKGNVMWTTLKLLC